MCEQLLQKRNFFKGHLNREVIQNRLFTAIKNIQKIEQIVINGFRITDTLSEVILTFTYIHMHSY